MGNLLGCSILAAVLTSTSEVRPPDAVEIFSCPFDQKWDVNYDDWPDLWTRKRGDGFPTYVVIQIRSDTAASHQKCLSIELDGGAASIFSPPVTVNSLSSYLLQGKLKTDGLRHHQAFVSITFYDADSKPLETHTSRKLRHVPEWETVQIGVVSPKHQEVATAVIGLHLHPGEKRDLHGLAKFDDIWLARLPRINLQTDRPMNIYTDPKDVRITCAVSGISRPDPEITFELLDALGNVIDKGSQQLDGRQIQSLGTSDPSPSSPDGDMGYRGGVEWQPTINAFGYYQVRVTMQAADYVLHERQIALAVVRPGYHPANSEFGWTLASGDEALPIDTLTELLPHVGIGWLKFPLWYGERDEARGDQLLKFAQRLETMDIQLVGLINKPPDEVKASLDEAEHRSVASILSLDSSVWHPSLDPVMTRLSLKIRWWQLGDDHDTSFVGYPDLAKTIQAIRDKLFRIGQKVHVGIAWDWLSEPPDHEEPTWEFVTYSASSPLTGSDLAIYLDAIDSPSAPQPWVLIEPLARSDYHLATRARDLVEKIVAAKVHHADGIFLADPINSETGLMNEDGSLGPLLLPWRTTALFLGGSTYLGHIRTPCGSQNHIFSRDGKAVMVIWNDAHVTEKIYLGEDVEQVDLWGRTTRPRQEDHRQMIEVGVLPTFITGIHEAIAKWRMALTLQDSKMPGVFGKPHNNAITLENFFHGAVAVDIRLVTPQAWRTFPQRMQGKLAVGERQQRPFEVTLPLGVGSGKQDVRVDFDLMADRRYRFGVFRQLAVGLGDIEIQTSTRLDQNGALIVEQQTTNHSLEKINFRFLLYAPNRRSKRSHVMDLEQGEDIKLYRYPDGRSLIGETLWLRAEEIEGLRIFNHRFVAEE